MKLTLAASAVNDVLNALERHFVLRPHRHVTVMTGDQLNHQLPHVEKIVQASLQQLTDQFHLPIPLNKYRDLHADWQYLVLFTQADDADPWQINLIVPFGANTAGVLAGALIDHPLDADLTQSQINNLLNQLASQLQNSLIIDQIFRFWHPSDQNLGPKGVDPDDQVEYQALSIPEHIIQNAAGYCPPTDSLQYLTRLTLPLAELEPNLQQVIQEAIATQTPIEPMTLSQWWSQPGSHLQYLAQNEHHDQIQLIASLY